MCPPFFWVKTEIRKVFPLELIVLIDQPGHLFFVLSFLLYAYHGFKVLSVMQDSTVRVLCETLGQDLNISIYTLTRYTAAEV